jgi:GNAT superfamily N-acetyltransferase
MLGGVHPVLRTLETYYDAAPRAQADVEDIGRFTLFLKQGDVEECPLLILDPSLVAPDSRRVGEQLTGRVRALGLDDDLDAVVGAVHAGFEGTDEVNPKRSTRQAEMMHRGLLAMVGAYDAQGAVVGGGSHGPRGDTTEVTGIAVLPRARRNGFGAAIAAALVDDALARGVRTVFLSAQDHAVARVYERVGFIRVGTACIAEPS